MSSELHLVLESRGSIIDARTLRKLFLWITWTQMLSKTFCPVTTHTHVSAWLSHVPRLLPSSRIKKKATYTGEPWKIRIIMNGKVIIIFETMRKALINNNEPPMSFMYPEQIAWTERMREVGWESMNMGQENSAIHFSRGISLYGTLYRKKEIVMMMTARGEIAGEVHFFSFHS